MASPAGSLQSALKTTLNLMNRVYLKTNRLRPRKSVAQRHQSNQIAETAIFRFEIL